MIVETPLATQRLLLDTLTPQTASGSYASWFSDPYVTRFIEGGREKPSSEELEQYISGMNESPYDLLLGIFMQDTRTHIGNIKIGSIDRFHKRGDIGLLIGERSQWGKGYGSEAIGAVTEYAEKPLGLRRVFAGCHATNAGSVAAFVKAGFEIEGRMREHARDGDTFVDGIIVGKRLGER
tara:strand:- start:340 stop:879 length:540 start_codon:yes stop_codon:yes gene_type:complete